MENLPTIALVIVSIVTAFSPIITTYINNKNNIKIKKIEIYETAKQEALKHFINSCSSYFSVSQNEKLRIETLSSMHNLLIYFEIDDVLQNTILEAINNHKHQQLNYAVSILSKQIYKEVKPLKI